MTDKEKEAIERCNQLIKVEHANWIGISNQKAIGTVLNLVQTQQEEIERLKKTELKAKGGGVKVTLEGLLELKAEIEKKDKIIDEMARTFYDTESLCVNDEIKVDCKHNCTDCIKQYFINKVEKEI